MSSSITRFFDTWGMTDATSCAAAVISVVSEDVYCADPSTPTSLNGVPSRVDHIAKMTASRPGSTIKVSGQSTHNGHAPATFDFIADGKLGMRGQHFADLNNEGNITRMVGFIGIGDGA